MEKLRTRNSRHVSLPGYESNINQRSYSRQGSDIPDCYEINNNRRQKSRNTMTGAPMKKLLSEEMSKDMVPRKRSPGLIARLMGLDGLPPQQPFEKEQKWLSERHLPDTLSEESRRYETALGSKSQKLFKEEQEFKDVFEVMEMPRIERRNHSAVTSGAPELAENDIDFLLRKYISAKRSSSESKLQESKDLTEVFDDLHSSRNLVSKFDALLQSERNHYPLGQSSHKMREPKGAESRNNQKARGFLSDIACPKHAAENQLRSRIRMDTDECSAEPTRIVILKPNLKRLRSIRSKEMPLKSFDTLSGPAKTNESSIVLLSTKHKFKESRDFPRKMTVKTRSDLPSSSAHFSASKGYAGDESSTNLSDYDSAYEVEPRKSSAAFAAHCNTFSPYSTDSKVSREAQKRLSERWKLNHKSIDVRVNDSGTLGEMLSMPNRDAKHYNSDAAVNSRRKYQDVVHSRSRSFTLPNSNPGREGCNETFTHDRFLIPNEASLKERSNLVPKHGSPSRARRYCSSKSSISSNIEGSDYSLGDIEKSLVVSQASPLLSLEQNSSYEAVLQGGTQTPNSMCKSPTCSGADAMSYFTELDTEELQRPSNQSGNDNKESDQPSPVSVLETSFADEVSPGSECFGSLSADLQGLRMQLELLKRESELYTDRKTVSSSDEETDDTSADILPDNGIIDESSIQCSYFHDILLRANIDDTDPDTYAASCHSLECPVNPQVFEELEKKYRDASCSWERPERKLLFDQINSALSVLYRKFVDPHPWAGRSKYSPSRRWKRDGVAADIRKCVLEDEKVCFAGKLLECELEWAEFGDDVDVIGREVERMVCDELFAELLC